eukprot:GILK01012508.1.p1 GENE.GILK01012508.1~~GILK01012508.1.p1  ORF type:complete len:521 (+),score=96.05 GILK01012508.1:37-1599(+)
MQQLDSLAVVILCSVLIFIIVIANFIEALHAERRYLWLSDGTVAMIVGALLGLVCHFSWTGFDKFTQFSSNVYLMILLPAIVFESGYTMKKRHFLRNLGTILLFALLGTILSALLMGLLCYGASLLLIKVTGDPTYGIQTMSESFLFGALISPVDPVATLTIFKAVGADPLLYNLMFGESMLNDPVAIAVFKTFHEIALQGDVDIGISIAKFLWLLGGSALIGLSLGLLSALILKHMHFHHATMEVTVLYMLAMICYFAAEACYASGIAAIFFCASIMGHLSWYNLSPLGQLLSKNVFRITKTVCELVVFASLGTLVFQCLDMNWAPGFTILVMVFCFLSRFFVIVPLSAMSNCVRDPEHQITFSHQFAASFTGLRGAFSMALALSLMDDYNSTQSFKSASVIVTSTLVAIPFSVIVFGGFTAPLLRALNLCGEEAMKKRLSLQDNQIALLDLADDANFKSGTVQYSGLVQKLKSFDKDFLRGIFVRDPKPQRLQRRYTNEITQAAIDDEIRELAERNDL